MSLGSPRVTLRIPENLLEQIKETIDRNNLRARGEPWDTTSWIIDAIRDKLAHQDRGRKKHDRPRKQIKDPLGPTGRLADLLPAANASERLLTPQGKREVP